MLTNLFKISGGAAVLYMAALPFIEPPKDLAAEQIKATKEREALARQKAEEEKKKNSLPDFGAIYDVKQKKKAFFDYLTPYVKQINQELATEHSFIQSLQTNPNNEEDAKHLAKLAKKYRVKQSQDFVSIKSELLKRVDQLPIELVLMQAANESAWGTSRFALQANNLFGQWCFKPGCGVVPEGRPEGETYEVRKFNHPAESVKSYFYNLNTGYAYEDLRIVRHTLRSLNEELDPMVLAEGLLAYSTRREAYVDEIQKMISVNAKYISK